MEVNLLGPYLVSLVERMLRQVTHYPQLQACFRLKNSLGTASYHLVQLAPKGFSPVAHFATDFAITQHFLVQRSSNPPASFQRLPILSRYRCYRPC